MKKFFSKYKLEIGLVLLVLAGFFVRGFHFSDWLVFRADQARDAYYAQEAFEEGIGGWRLLGPRAGAAVELEGDEEKEALHLGPAYYYFQNVSALIFGSPEPFALAVPDLVFSTLAIFVFYFFLRFYFPRLISFGLTAVFSFSFVLIQYSRFGWNTNQLVFWQLLFLLSILTVQKLSQENQFAPKDKPREKVRACPKSPLLLQIPNFGCKLFKARQRSLGYNFLAFHSFRSKFETFATKGDSGQALKKKIGFWLIVAFFSLSILTQLHVLCLFGFPVVALIFFLIYRPKIKLKCWLIGVGVFLLPYLPVFVHEAKTDFDNSRRFWAVLALENQNAESSGGVLAKNLEVFKEAAQAFVLALSSLNKREVDNLEIWGAFWIAASLVLIIFLLFKRKKARKTFWNFRNLCENLKKEPFLILNFLWFLIFFFIYLKSDRLNKTRYFLPIIPLAFVFLGVWIKFVFKIKIKKLKNLSLGKVLALLIFSALIFLNLEATFYWYRSLAAGQLISAPFRAAADLGPHEDLITFGSMKRSVQGIVERAAGEKICYYSREYQYKLGFEYIFQRYFPTAAEESFGGDDAEKNCRFFLIDKAKRKDRGVHKDFQENFGVKDYWENEALIVWELSPKAGDDDFLRFGFLTDVHAYSKPVKNENGEVTHWEMNWRVVEPMEKFMDRMNNQFKPDFILENGDLVDGGPKHKEEFLKMKELIEESDAPLFQVLGNHEIRGFDKAEWLEMSGMENTYYYFDIKNFRIIVLDANFSKTGESLRKGQNVYAGSINQAQMEWLEQKLSDAKARNKTALVFLHQYPGPFLESGREAESFFISGGVLRDIFSKYQVRAVFSGHVEELCNLHIDGVEYFSLVGMHRRNSYLPRELTFKDQGIFYEVSVNNQKDKVEVRMYYKPKGEEKDGEYQTQIVNQETAFCNDEDLKSLE